MHKLEMLLRKYANNFLLLEDFPNNAKIEYLNFNNIIVITDTNLVKISSVKKVINYLQNNFCQLRTMYRNKFCFTLMIKGKKGKSA